MTRLFHWIVKIIIVKLIHTKLIDNRYACESKNNVDLKKTLIIYNTIEYFEVFVKLNILFIISNGKNGEKNTISFNKQKNDKNSLLENNVKVLI